MSYHIGDHGPDPYERVRVERIEADKQTKRDLPKPFEEEPPKQHPFALVAYLLQMLHQFLDLFRRREVGGANVQEVQDHLFSMRAALDTLKTEDRSQDTPFLHRLSLLWHKILDDLLLFQRESVIARQLKAFIQEIDSYREVDAFSFGYYLTEYAGQKWLPFPYMELVQKLHHQHQKNPEGSALTRWTAQLDALIQAL